MGRVITVSAVILTLGTKAFALQNPSAVFVLEGGADLNHPELSAYLNTYRPEATGTNGVDDNQDGFNDNITGWNFVSEDPHYFPAHLRAVFTGNPQRADEVFEVYSQVESGDTAASERLGRDMELQRDLGTFLDLSHATHVAGIVAKNSATSAKIQSLNIFEPSTPAQPQGARLARGENPALRGGQLQPGQSFFDDRARLDTFLDAQAAHTNHMAERTAEYIRQSQAGVVNVSLGWTLALLKDHYNGMWMRELQSVGAAFNTRRSPAQEENFQRAVQRDFDMWKAYWERVITGNPDVLFVVAAGNDGTIPALANNDTHEDVPSNFNTRYRNVISVAATTQQGAIVDFSNFGATTVNVGAWGKAVNSLAPDGNHVIMSGTSMAAPNVAGVASRLRAINPSLSAGDVRSILESTGLEHASLRGKTTSGRMIDPQAAALAAQASGGPQENLRTGIQMARRARANFAPASSTTLFGSAMTGLAELFESAGGQEQVSQSPELVHKMMQALRSGPSALSL